MKGGVGDPSKSDQSTKGGIPKSNSTSGTGKSFQLKSFHSDLPALGLLGTCPRSRQGSRTWFFTLRRCRSIFWGVSFLSCYFVRWLCFASGIRSGAFQRTNVRGQFPWTSSRSGTTSQGPKPVKSMVLVVLVGKVDGDPWFTWWFFIIYHFHQKGSRRDLSGSMGEKRMG